MGRRPIWTEGLLVSQHHFQAQDRYHEDLLRERLSTLRRFGWGVAALEIDDRLLQAGQFGLRRLVAVWPDGVVVQCGGASGDPLPEPRPFEPHMRAEDATLDVHVGITNEGGANVVPYGEAVTQQRFARVARSVDDANTGGGAQELEFAVPNLRIVFGTERRERMVTLPVAQLVRQADGRAVVRDTFVPPVLDIAAAPFVTSGLRRVLGAMVARQRELAAGRKQRSSSSIEFHYTDARRFWLLHTLSGAIPTLSHLLDAEPVHPEEVYLALATLVGQLATFSADTDLSIVPRFDYGRLGDVFEPLFARALSLVSVDSAPVYTEIPLQRRSDGMFVGKLHEARLAEPRVFHRRARDPPGSDGARAHSAAAQGRGLEAHRRGRQASAPRRSRRGRVEPVELAASQAGRLLLPAPPRGRVLGGDREEQHPGPVPAERRRLEGRLARRLRRRSHLPALIVMVEPSADAMYRACADVLAAAAQIGNGWGAPPAPTLRNDMVAHLRQFVSRCRDAGIPDAETAEARYAIVAFIDDRVLKESAWAGRAEWMNNPLQLQFFREYAAGENFFGRMRALAQRGGPSSRSRPTTSASRSGSSVPFPEPGERRAPLGLTRSRCVRSSCP